MATDNEWGSKTRVVCWVGYVLNKTAIVDKSMDCSLLQVVTV
jgi:hypothetical protein